MFDEYLESINNKSEKYIEYAKDITNYITSSINDNKPLYATHSHCTDGGVAGAMIRYSIPGAAIIPLDYWMINDENISAILYDLPWKGIVDLKPFNNNFMDFWVDHHISARNASPNANRIRFDADGDSGSYQLLLSEFLGAMPEHLVELAVMTRITDTAGYSSEPPVEQISDLTELDLSTTSGERGNIANERRIWVLDDAWGSAQSLKDHLNLHNYLAKDGFYGLSKVLDRINTLRSGRKEAYNIADKMETSDIVAFSFDEDTQDKFTILRRLQKNGVKIAISLSKTEDGQVKISFRRNRFLSEELNEQLQVQKIAAKLNGGGHPGAAGAVASGLEEALAAITKWAEEKDFEFNHFNL